MFCIYLAPERRPFCAGAGASVIGLKLRASSYLGAKWLDDKMI